MIFSRSDFLDRPGWASATARGASLIVPFGVFVAVLNTTLSPSILVASHRSLTPVVAIAFIALAACYRRPGWISALAGLSVTLGLYALPLAAVWQDAVFHGNAVGGLLPWSDASGYYYDARRLIDGHLLGWSARRPLFVGFLSSLLALTGQNLQVTLAVMVAINAVASFLFGRELRESFGAWAAAAGSVVLFLFYRHIGGLGTTLTENLGLSLGVCGFAALMRGARLLESRSLLTGLGLVTVALISRAGAFFVLPALVLAVASMFREPRRWFRAGAAAVATVLFAAALALGVGRLLADPVTGSTDFSNFSSSLYGLVTGGKGWTQVQRDHPEATEGPEIYALAYQAFIDRPSGVVEGSMKMWREYLNPTRLHNAFAFVGRPATYPWQIRVCFLLSAIAMLNSLRRIRQPLHALVVVAVIGHLASIPFVPPVDAGLRVYAATLPIQAILIAMGLSVVSRQIRRVLPDGDRPIAPMGAEGEATRLWPRAAQWLGLTLTAVSLAGPMVILWLSHPQPLVDLKCEAGATPVQVRVSSGSFLRIRGDSELTPGRAAATEVQESRLAFTAGRNEIGGDAPRFTAGNTMVNGYDLKSGRYVWLVAPTDRLEKVAAVYAICGHDTKDPLARNYGVFYADSVWQTGGQP